MRVRIGFEQFAQHFQPVNQITGHADDHASTFDYTVTYLLYFICASQHDSLGLASSRVRQSAGEQWRGADFPLIPRHSEDSLLGLCHVQGRARNKRGRVDIPWDVELCSCTTCFCLPLYLRPCQRFRLALFRFRLALLLLGVSRCLSRLFCSEATVLALSGGILLRVCSGPVFLSANVA